MNSTRPIFIFGQARSGTTLLQRLLNSTGEAFIYGEHAGFLKGVAYAYFVMFKHRAARRRSHINYYFKERKPEDLLKPFDFLVATHTGFSREDLTNHFREFVTKCINAHGFQKRWGFKEIHYGMRDRTFSFLRELYVSASFVFIVRNPAHQISSKMGQGWWPQYSFEENVDIWCMQATNFKKYIAEHPAQCQLLRYEEFSTDTAVAKSTFAKLGLPFGPKQNSILNGSKVGATAHKRIISDSQRDIIVAKCAPISLYDDQEIKYASF